MSRPDPPRPGPAAMCCGTPKSPVTCTCPEGCQCNCPHCNCHLTGR